MKNTPHERGHPSHFFNEAVAPPRCRYLAKDEGGHVGETPESTYRRVARAVAGMKRGSTDWLRTPSSACPTHSAT